MRGSAAVRTGVVPGGVLAGPWVKNELWRRARSIPSLDLRFADNKNLTDAVTGQNLITFTRASSGTFVNSEGLIQAATTNLSLRSQELGDAAWTKTASSITADAAIAPNGTTTADKLVEDSSTGTHNIVEAATITYTSGLAYTFSFFIKKAERQTVQILMHPNPFPGTLAQRTAIFNSNTGAFVSVGSAYTGSAVTVFSDGWYRVSVSSTSDATSSGNFAIALCSDDIGTTSYTGNGTSGLFLWGAQLEQSSTVGEYIPTISVINSAPRFDHNPTTGESLGLLVEEARTNLTQKSQEFEDVYWSRLDCTITANESTAPDGTLTADLWTNTASPGIISNSITKDATSRTYTGSLWVKGGATQFTMSIDNGGTINRGRVVFNLSSNTISSANNDGNFTNTSGSITLYSNGWKRLTITTTTSTITTIRFRPFFSGSGSTVRIWGAQVEEGAFATSYIPTTTATVTRSADVASITGANFGTTRTNNLLCSEDFGTVWTQSNITVTTDTVTAPDGTTTADTFGPVVGDGLTVTRFLRQNPALTTQGAYTFSVFVKVGTATTNGIALVVTDQTATNNFRGSFNLFTLTSGATSTGWATPTSAIVAYPNGWYRCILSGVTSTAHASLRTNIYLSTFGSVSDTYGTIHLWGAQLEVGSAVTPYIPTTSATASVFDSPWYRQDEGTVFVDNTSYAINNTRIVSFSDNTASNRISIARGSGSSGNINTTVTAGGAAQVSALIFASSLGANTALRVTGGYRTSDFAGSVNEAALVTQATGSMPTTVSQLGIGNGEALGANTFSGTLKRLAYWPRRLENSTLQEVTR